MIGRSMPYRPRASDLYRHEEVTFTVAYEPDDDALYHRWLAGRRIFAPEAGYLARAILHESPDCWPYGPYWIAAVRLLPEDHGDLWVIAHNFTKNLWYESCHCFDRAEALLAHARAYGEAMGLEWVPRA